MAKGIGNGFPLAAVVTTPGKVVYVQQVVYWVSEASPSLMSSVSMSASMINIDGSLFLFYFEMIFSGVRQLLNPYKPEGPKDTNVYYGQIKRSRHSPQCGHTPRTVRYKTIEHAVPFLFHFQCFSTCI